MYSIYRAFTVITYSEGYVTAPYASSVIQFGNVIETFGTNYNS